MLGLIIYSYWEISRFSAKQIYSEVEKVPYHKVGLVLGTTRFMTDGSDNPFFLHRMDAAAALYHAGRIEQLLVSGDNLHEGVHETVEMKYSLIERNVPEEKIKMDRFGLRTLDSVLRAKNIFGLNELTFISQEFHNERAIFLAQHHGMETVGYNAEDVGGWTGLVVHLREYLARVKAMLDIHILDTQPRFPDRTGDI